MPLVGVKTRPCCVKRRVNCLSVMKPAFYTKRIDLSIFFKGCPILTLLISDMPILSKPLISDFDINHYRYMRTPAYSAKPMHCRFFSIGGETNDVFLQLSYIIMLISAHRYYRTSLLLIHHRLSPC